MPWSGLLKVLDRSHGAEAVYKSLVLRIEDTQESGWMVRLYDGPAVIAEALEDSPQQAVQRVIEAARSHLQDDSIDADSFAWVQMTR